MIKPPRILILIASILGLIILYSPIFIVIIYSFNSANRGMVWQEFSIRWYIDVWNDRDIINALLNSIKIAFITSSFSFLIGVSIGYLLSIVDRVKFVFLSTILFIPLLTPDLLISISNALFYTWLGIDKGIFTISLSQSIVGSAYIALFVSVRLHSIDFRSCITSAASLGASSLRIFRDHFLRISYSVAFLGAGLVIMISIQDFLYAFFCGGDGTTTLSVHVYGLIRFGPNGGLNVIYTLIILITWVILLVNSKIKLIGEKNENYFKN